MPVFFILLIIVTIAALILKTSRSQSLLDQWAQQNGFRIVNSERRMLMRGPMFLTTTKGQEVYYVTVEDQAGKVRSGYVRCGGKMLGMLSDNVDVRWDDPSNPSAEGQS